MNTDVTRLLEAKRYSDSGQYKHKHAVLAFMLNKNPEDWVIDSEHGNGNILGITHKPSKFKIHIPRKFVPSMVKKAGE